MHTKNKPDIIIVTGHYIGRSILNSIEANGTVVFENKKKEPEQPKQPYDLVTLHEPYTYFPGDTKNYISGKKLPRKKKR